MTVTRRRAALVVASALTAGLITGGGALAWASTEKHEEVPSSDARAALASTFAAGPESPLRKGEVPTVGAWKKGEPAPDLTPIDLEDGTSGFLRVYDLANGSSNPEFKRETDRGTDFVLPVYAKDGQTVIGEFLAGSSTSE